MPAPTDGDAAAPSTKENVSDVMSAIQRVLAEHNMSDARFILEVPHSTSAKDRTTDNGGSAADERKDASDRTAGETALLSGLHAIPATTPPALPAHDRPPPRARNATTEPPRPHVLLPTAPPATHAGSPSPSSPPQREPRSQSQTATPPTLTSQGSAELLDSTAKPPHDASALATPILMSPLQYSLQSTESHTTPGPAGFGGPSSLTSNPTERGGANLTSELAELRRLSHEVAQEVASVDGEAASKAPLQSFVGRSAILDDRRKRQSASSATSQWLPSNGLPLFPTPPPITPTATTTSFDHRPSAFQSGSSRVSEANGGANGHSPASVAIAGSTESLVASRTPATQRRSVVLVSSPDRRTSSTGASASGSAGGVGGSGGGAGTIPSAGSLPSLVAMKKSARPGRTPVFSILNKEGSHLPEGNSGNNNNNNSNSASGGSSSTSISNSHNGNVGSTAPPRPLTPSNGKTRPGSGTSSGSGVNAPHHARPLSVSLMADDRHPPSPVFQPLVGTAAEEQACRCPSILVQSGQPTHARPLSPPDAAINLSTATTTGAATSVASRDSTPSPPPSASLWSERSRENTRRALQLQSQSRLSQTTETLGHPVIDGSGVGSSPVKHRRLFNPALSGRAAKTGGATPLTPSPPPLPPAPPSTFSLTATAHTTGGSTGGTGANASGGAPAEATATIITTTAAAATAPASPGRPSLREMLLEQQQLEDANRRGMAEHAKLMQAANTARTASTTPPFSSSSPLLAAAATAPATIAAPMHGSPHRVSAASSDETGGSVSTGSRTANLPLSGTPKGTSTASVSPRTSGAGISAGGGIQVVKFTLPHDAEARQSAAQQLCRSSSGSKHIESKDRYRALLATQKEELTNKDEKEENYKDLLSRAVEYNRVRRPQ